MILLLVVAASTTTAAFGVSNPFWEGASQLQQEADTVGADTVIARSTGPYTQVTPNETVALVLSPDKAYSDNDTRRIRTFVRQGGTLVVAEDFGAHSNSLLSDVGASARFNGSLLRDQRYNYRTSGLPIVINVTSATVTTGVENLTLNHGTVLRPNGATVLARSSEFSYLDRNRNGAIDDTERPASYPVVTVEQHGDGRIIAVSDPSLFINLMLERPGNNRFVRNLFGTHDSVLLDYSHAASLPPLAVALIVLRELPLLQIGLGLAGLLLVWQYFHGSGLPVAVIRGEESSRPRSPTLSAEEIAEYLEREHPEWDGERIRRVTEDVITRRPDQPDNE